MSYLLNVYTIQWPWGYTHDTMLLRCMKLPWSLIMNIQAMKYFSLILFVFVQWSMFWWDYFCKCMLTLQTCKSLDTCFLTLLSKTCQSDYWNFMIFVRSLWLYCTSRIYYNFSSEGSLPCVLLLVLKVSWWLYLNWLESAQRQKDFHNNSIIDGVSFVNNVICNILFKMRVLWYWSNMRLKMNQMKHTPLYEKNTK